MHFHNLCKGPIHYLEENKPVIEPEELSDHGEKNEEDEKEASPDEGEVTEDDEIPEEVEPGTETVDEKIEKKDAHEIATLPTKYFSPLEGITAQDLHDNFNKISKLFGLKSTVKSILELQNQSLSNLLRDFPDLESLDKVEIMENPDILEKSEK